MCKFLVQMAMAGENGFDYHDGGSNEPAAEDIGRRLIAASPDIYTGFKIFSHAATFSTVLRIERQQLS